MIAQIFAIVAPVIFIALLGYVWSHFKWRYDGEFISRIVMDVGAPCLILSTMLKSSIPSTDVGQMTQITLIGLVLLFLINGSILAVSKHAYRTYLPPLSFANTGNMGVPICLFAFGQEGMALALVLFMVTSMVHFSLGISLVGGQHPLKTLTRSPVFYSALLAFFFVYTDYTLPASLFNTLDILGGMAIPLMLFSLGVSLHSLQASSFLRSLVFGFVRLLVGFSVGLFLCWLFDLQGVMKGVVLIQSAMPSAVFNYLLAANYKQQPEEVAGVVVFSTLMSFALLPVLLWYIL